MSLPSLANIDHVDAVLASLPQVRLHVNLQVLATQVRLGSEEHLNVMAGGVERRGQVGRGHLDG